MKQQAKHAEIEGAPRCLNCASTRIEGHEHYGPTGVYAPDGGAEYRYEIGVRCLDCGAIEDTFGVFPELDELEEMLEYFADAPIGDEFPVRTRKAA
jgi:hypothetical protein